MKSVAIIGAGPAGLAAAKTFLQHPSAAFRVVTFEKSSRPGGLWAVDADDTTGGSGGTMDPRMPTNLSKYTVSFSDLSWEEVSLVEPGLDGPKEQSGAAGRPAAPMFPRAWQVGRYLAEYARRFVPPECILLNRRVESAERLTKHGKASWRLRWSVTSSDPHNSSTEEAIFDYLVVASGFFSDPAPAELLGGTTTCVPDAAAQAAAASSVKSIHSSAFRHIRDVTPDAWDGPGSLLVIGGAMSGVEAAGALAFRLSSQRHSPASPATTGTRAPASAVTATTPPPPPPKVYHVISRPVYALPTFVPSQSQSRQTHPLTTEQRPVFTPIDLELYDLSRRTASGGGTAVQQPTAARATAASAQRSHAYVRSLLGGDQSELRSAALVADSLTAPPRVAIHDTYSEFVRSGAIEVVAGRVTGLSPSPPPAEAQAELQAGARATASPASVGMTATIATPTGGTTTLSAIVGIIRATGYTSASSLSYLPPDVLAALDHDPACARMPLLLQDAQTSRTEAVPALGFVGFYEGPFWGVMEMQARLLAARWGGAGVGGGGGGGGHSTWIEQSDGDDAAAPTAVADATQELRLACEELDNLRDLRRGMLDGAVDVPQYWLGDYVGLMECLSAHLGLARLGLPSSAGADADADADAGSDAHADTTAPSPTATAARAGPVIPARYASSTPTPSHLLTLTTLHADLSQPHPRFASRAFFRALQGRWTLHRRLTSHDTAGGGLPSGTVTGTAWWHPRAPTGAGASANFTKEHLYIEDGVFAPGGGGGGLAGVALRATRRYVWRYDEARERVSLWFVEPGDGVSVDYLFLELELEPELEPEVAATPPPPQQRGEGGDGGRHGAAGSFFVARATHWCDPDAYEAEVRWRFGGGGAALRDVGVRYRVRGPRKDYVSESWYARA